jgi:hypothetical protein
MIPVTTPPATSDTKPRGLLTDTAAIHDGPEAGQLRGRAVLIPEG